MGTYVNPGHAGFAQINDSDYVDKTLLIDWVSQTIGKKNKLSCISRPRRFGKTWNARMLTAYYDRSCDSHELFHDKKIAQTADYETYLNKFNVICLDVSGFTSTANRSGISLRAIPNMIIKALWKDLVETGFTPKENDSLNDFLLRCVETEGGKPFIFIIDEWDVVIREALDDPEAQSAYLNLLRGWFKNENFTPKAVAAAYMTGILPIKKDGSQVAISDFKEYSVIKSRKFGPYVGFTEDEVRSLCDKHHADFETMKQWYDGYSLKGVGSVYNPNSVMEAIACDEFDSYWSESSASEPLMDYISKDYHGLTKTIAELIGGLEVKVNTNGFANDLTTFKGKDDKCYNIYVGFLFSTICVLANLTEYHAKVMKKYGKWHNGDLYLMTDASRSKVPIFTKIFEERSNLGKPYFMPYRFQVLIAQQISNDDIEGDKEFYNFVGGMLTICQSLVGEIEGANLDKYSFADDLKAALRMFLLLN